jgi:hypothetical protein
MTEKQIEFIKLLESKNEPNVETRIVLNLNKWSLSERTEHYGKFEDSDFTFTAYTNWKRSSLECGMTIEDFIEVLKETPIEKMEDGNFYDLWCNDMSDGDTEFEDEEFTPELTEEQEGRLDMSELYFDSEINDSEYIFEPGSIWGIEVEFNQEGGAETIVYETE